MKKIKTKQGNAIAISLTAIAFLTLVAVGASTVIMNSYKASKNVERNNNAFLAAESGIENALYEVSDHSAGYEVINNEEENDHARVNLEAESNAEAYWSVESRSSMEQALANNSNSIFIPAQQTADPDEDVNWATADFGSPKVIKLYADNTSCTADDGKNCDYVEQ